MREPSLEEVQQAVHDDYLVEGLLGKGGMGVVFRARNRTLDSAVAIKVLPVAASVGADELARFRREAMIAARLQHPNIVPVYEFDVRDDLAYLVMPLIDGVPLDRRIAQQGRLTWKETRELLGHIGGALAFAHGRGVVHRDVKPANILWEAATGRWLITDFGIARPVQEDGTVLTFSGERKGTPAYWPPEQAAGMEVDQRADLYCLGAVAFEALTGTRPEAMGDAERAAEGLRRARPELSARRAAALAAPLALDRAERPASADEWLARVDAADSSRGVRRLLAAATLIGAALTGLVLWQRQADAPAGAAAPLTAVVPLAVPSPTGELGPALGDQLADAFAEQLRWLPDQRVAPASAVGRAVREHFGGIPDELDTLTAFVADAFGAARVLTGQARAADADRIQVTMQLWAPGGVPLRADSATAPTDSLGDLVHRLTASLFAEGLAREQVGWSQVLPQGARAVRAFLAARPRFRAGAYDEAVELYQEVIAADPTFAPAYFERMWAEIMRAQPTRASHTLRAALDATRRYRDRLDPATRDLLTGYETLVADGDVERAHEQFDDLTLRYPNAPDAFFILGYLEFYFGPLFQVDPARARFALERASALAPEFAAPHGLLAWIDLLENRPEAQEHLRQYLSIDSTSAVAGLVRMVDSLRFRGARAAIAVAASVDRQPTRTLEMIALGSSSLTLRPSEREVAADAVGALQERATTAADRAIAFRLEMALLLGGGRVASAESVLREARRGSVPRDEVDAWVGLLAVTRVAPTLPDAAQVDEAVARLATAVGDPTSQWLVARWTRGRGGKDAGAARRRLQVIADTTQGAGILARSLLEDLIAHDRLAAGDTAGALGAWERATRSYWIEEVPFGLVASLWPLDVERARVAAARGEHDEVAVTTARFPYAVGFVDQVARLTALPLRVDALQATGDPLRARELAEQLLVLWSAADGAGVSVRDAVRARVPGL